VVENALGAAKPSFAGSDAFSRSRAGLITILVPEDRAKHRLWRTAVPITTVVETVDADGKVLEKLGEHIVERGEKSITLPYAKIAGKIVRFSHTVPSGAVIDSPVKSAKGLWEIQVLPQEFETAHCRYDLGGVVSDPATTAGKR
jgi:hypothetical protein